MTDWEDDIKRYRNHEMTPEEEHAFEKKVLSDPFLAEALEGASTISSQDFADDMADLHKKIHQKAGGKIWIWPLRIAASLALIVIAYFAIAPWLKNDTNHLALQKSETIEQQPVASGAQNDTTIASAEKKQEPLRQLNTTSTKEKSNKAGESDKNRQQKNNVQLPLIVTSDIKEGPSEEKIIDSEVAHVVTEEKMILAAQDQIEKSKTQSESLAQKENLVTRNFTLKPSHRLVQGKVLAAEDDTPIPGVNIIVKGTQNGTTTDINGNYRLAMDSSHSDLIFTFIGLQTKEVEVANQSEVTVKLEPDVSQLSEVVVTGYNAFTPVAGREPVIKLAEPAGGRRAYDKYLHNSIRYPQQALENKIKGRVTVQFIVRTDGSLDEFNVLKGLGYGCDEEVIRLVKEGPKWSPTTEDSVPIESEVRVRVKFALPD